MGAREFSFESEVWLPAPHERVFEFFSNAANLDALTPDWLRFDIVTSAPINMGPGTLIDYRIRVHGCPVRWRTEITEWEPPRRFVDMQVKGPYRLWHHTHTFEERNGGTLCGDAVRYWPRGGTLMDRLCAQGH